MIDRLIDDVERSMGRTIKRILILPLVAIEKGSENEPLFSTLLSTFWSLKLLLPRSSKENVGGRARPRSEDREGEAGARLATRAEVRRLRDNDPDIFSNSYKLYCLTRHEYVSAYKIRHQIQIH